MEQDVNKYSAALKKAIDKINDLNIQIQNTKVKSDIAVIGYNCRFPAGADDADKFWKLLLKGYDAVTEIDAERFDIDPYYDPKKSKTGKAYTKQAAFINQNIREFDNAHFEISAKEAVSIDPQHKLLFEVIWEAMENAGLDIDKLKGSNTGIFLGMDGLEYAKAEFLSDDMNDITPYSLMGISQHSAAGRMAYFYDFKGPAQICNTACSSSLVAITSAVESLKLKQCDMAVVGGVNLMLTSSAFVALSQIQALSYDGRCKAFDRSADGYGRGEGCGVVILKRLEDAIRDGNRIEAVIKSSCVGQDGRANGFFAPNGLAQQRVMKKALIESGLSVDDISYIEAHGTGTTIGDYIEAQSICEVYKKKKNKMLIGSVKSNIGHLEAASGIAGFIKVLLSMRYKMLPPSIHFNNPNPNINWERLQVTDKTMDWTGNGHKRCAAISSFGISGTLVHIIVEEPDELNKETKEMSLPKSILTLSAKSEDALKEYIYLMQNFIEESDENIHNIVYSSNVTRGYGRYRYALQGYSRKDFISGLKSALVDENIFLSHYGKPRNDKKAKLFFAFKDEDSIEYYHHVQQIYQNFDVYKSAIEECEMEFFKLKGISVKKVFLASYEDLKSSEAIYKIIKFSTMYAMVQTLSSFGIRASLVTGTGIGEINAAVYSGILDFGSAVRLVMTNDNSYSEVLNQIKFSVAEIPFISSTVQSNGLNNDVSSLQYWVNKSRKYDLNIAAKKALDTNADICVEIGSNDYFIKCKKLDLVDDNIRELSIEVTEKDSFDQFMKVLEELYLFGVSLEWVQFYKPYKKKLITLPNYAFQKLELWKEFKSTDIRKQMDENSMGAGNHMNSTINIEGQKRLNEIKNKLQETVSIITNISAGQIYFDSDLFHFGFDSLMLMNLGEHIKKLYGIEISLEDFFTSLGTIDSIANYIDSILPAEDHYDTELYAMTAEKKVSDTLDAANDDNVQDMAVPTEKVIGEEKILYGENIDLQQLSKIFENQIKIMAGQNEIISQLAGTGSMSKTCVPVTQKEANELSASLLVPTLPAVKIGSKTNLDPIKKEYYVPYHKFEKENNNILTKQQLDYVKKIEDNLNTLTRKSKNRTQEYRHVFSSARNVAGFNQLSKEMTYQIVAKQVNGSKIIDLDDNEFVDISMGFGVNLFGHAPSFIKEAFRNEIDRGFPLGPMGELPGKVAEQITELTKTERVFFCNSGTEANMFAMRMARAITGRNIIVCFAGAYHGSYDGVLGLPSVNENGEQDTISMVPGVTENAVSDLLILSYNSEMSLKYIEEHSDEIAGVLVEAVQSRRPDIQPHDFLHKLRKLTSQKDIALIFDEVITGFRIAAGGAQEFFGIQADIVTYGKIVGGGLPIGVVAGKSKYLDSVDGGMWSFGDDSIPSCNDKRTLATGTFCHNGLTMAAANTILQYIKDNKDSLYKELNEKTVAFVDRVNSFFKTENIPYSIINFGSLFRFNNIQYYKHDIFFYSLIAKGIYIWEGRNCFLSTAHTREDTDKVFEAIKQTVYEMKASGFFDDPTDPDRLKKTEPKEHQISVELEDASPAQKDISASMSLIQERLYTQIMLSKEEPFDIVSAHFAKGDIDVDKLEAAIRQIIKKHEVLRTGLVLENGEFKQIISEHVDFSITRFNQEDEIEVNELINKSIKRFDLAQAPLFETVFVNIRNSMPLLIFHFHHSIADGMSMGVFVKEITLAYSGLTLDKIGKQYRDYVKWEADYLKSDLFLKDDEFWSASISDEYCGLELPTDFPSNSNAAYAGGNVSGFLNDVITAKLKEIGRKNNASLFMVLLSCVNIILHKYSRQKEIAVVTPVTNRFEGGFEDNIGMFTNTAVLCNTIFGTENYDEFLKRLRNNCLKSYRHMFYPYNYLINKYKFNNSKVFNVSFIYENTETRETQTSGIDMEVVNYVPHTQEFDLKFEFMENNGTVNIFVRYRKDVFVENSVELILNRLMIIINQIIADIQVKIENIDLTTEEERSLVLQSFNSDLGAYPKDKTIADIFEEQVALTPYEPALITKDRVLTYFEMNKMVNVLAHKLRKLGIEPDDRVVIIGDRTIEFLIGMYAVIKSGGAYVPVDPVHPDSRKQYIIHNCLAKVIIIADRNTEINIDIPMINLFEESLLEGNNENPEKVCEPHNLIYCIYTSGTSGEPKGVMIEHRSVVNYLYYSIRYFWSRKCIIPLFTNCCFDLAGTPLFLALCCGNALEIVAPDEHVDIAKYLIEDRYDSLKMTPSHLKIALESSKEGRANIRKHIVVGGEMLDKDTVLRILERFGDMYIHNEYGPTEATIGVTAYSCSKNDTSTKIPIGKPLSNTQLYIVNDGKLCGIGMPGEICIAGDCLGRGYINLPELTDSKFTDNLFGKGKMYRTGDLAKWLPDGNIECYGRMDEQVKIRGFRIELGEIESSIRNMEDVKECVAIAKNDKKSEKALFAYVVSDRVLNLNKIREKLKLSLPDYMIPTYMMQIDTIPITRNGKLDKRMLPDIVAKSDTEYIAPRNETEEVINGVFCDILQVDNIGVRDSFFDMGGNSLSATRLTNLIEAKIGCNITLKAMFANPTIESLAAIVDNSKIEEYVIIPKAEEKEYYPMSSTQKRIFLICQMDSEGISYNMPGNIIMSGDFKPEAIKKALLEMLRRHEILRTEFLMLHGEPVQRIKAEVEAEFEILDDAVSSEQELNYGFIRPFNLSRAPLVRMKLVKRKGNYLLLFDMHHIISDGISRSTFIREFTAHYNGEQLIPITRQYKDYSEWMRTKDLSSQKEYWVTEFSDDIPVLDMPLDFERPQEQSFAGKAVKKKVDNKLSMMIKELARKQNATDYMVFLSAAMVLLAKYSRQEDIIIGSPISARTHKDTEDMLGMFVNTLAMRGKPAGKKKYLEFLLEIKDKCLKAYENQEYPFEELVEAVEVRRDISRNPLFDVMLVLQNIETTKIKLDGATAEVEDLKETVAKFDLTFNIDANKDEFSISLEYCTDLFKEEFAEGLLNHYVRILENITENPEARICDIEVITEVEKLLILNDFNATDKDYPKDKCVAEIFEKQAEQTPGKIAVVYGDSEINYIELNEKANQLARKLRKLGVKPDDVVAVLTEKSTDVVVGMVGILKAGGAYSLINPAYPEERIRFMIEDCNPKAILLYKATVATDIPIIDLEESSIWDEDRSNLDIVNKPEDLAYIMYTSGTTGQPKGVMICNGNIIRLVKNCGYIEFNEDTVIQQTGQMAFDASTIDVWGSVLNGGRLHLIDEDVTNYEILKAQIDNNKINTMWLTATLFNQMITKDNYMFDNLKYLLTGGEKLSEKHIRLLKNHKSNVRLYNGYGPTENTTFTTIYEIPDNFKSLPIGKPIANTKVYILNGMELCGIGIPGELCTSGAGLGRGYLNRPELTTERYINNPYGDGKLYRTGDLVRWLSDGNIEFIGRIDEQVKIRGYRVELKEIENSIHILEGVKDCAVIAKPDLSGDMAIYAYLVSEEEINPGEIRAKLGVSVPNYMIPAYIMQIDRIPITKNGKLDRRALPNIEAKSGNEYTAPRNTKEKIICDAFEEILCMKQIGIKDNFFELGGNSLKAVRLANLIEQNTGYKLYMKDIFSNQTGELLAAVIDDSNDWEYISIPNAEKMEFYPMSSVQKRLYLIYQIDPENLVYNIPGCIKMSGNVKPERVGAALQEMIERHEILRTEFLLVDGEPVQKIKDIAIAEFEYTEDAVTEEDELIKSYAKPFVLANAPLVRMKLVKRDRDYLLLFDMHHIIGDGMSLATFIRELTAIYKGESLDLPNRQYKDYSEWMRARDLSSQKDYWINEFNDEVPVLDMPTDFKRPQKQSYLGRIAVKSLDKKLTAGIKEIAKKAAATDYMVLLSAAMILLGKYSRQEDIIIGSPVSGRTHKDTENLLGMFVNTLAMRGKPENKKTYAEFLVELKETCLKAYENQEYPFEELIEAIDIARDMSRNPLFDVMLALQNNDKPEFKLDDISFESSFQEGSIAKFDLTFNIEESNGIFEISLEYCTDLFMNESVERILVHYTKILKQIIDDPEIAIGDIETISKEERIKILGEFNETKTDYPSNKTISELFEEQVRKTPTKLAVVCAETKLTYRGLNKKANQLARKLRKQGLKPNDFVAIISEKSIETIIGILGVLKAGGAYVPIDSSYPEDRIRYMLDDCKPKVVLTYKTTVLLDIPSISLEEADIWNEVATDLKSVNKFNDLAYVIYTSGTTGHPKGVMIENQGVINLREYFIRNHNISEQDNVPQFASIAFDAMLSELSMSILNGGCLHIITKELVGNINKFEKYMYDNELSIGVLPPQFLSQLSGTSFRTVITAGAETNRNIVSKFGKNKVYSNDYGPTEVTVCATFCRFDGMENLPSRIPIGKPINNKQIYIMNGMKLCGIGIPGELCIAGNGLARGYLNNPKLTEEKFINNPYGEGRLYRSGDLAKWLPDGNIEFLGRIDEQVKIRGFRIELGEIESTIRSFDYVRDCAVIVRSDLSGDKAIYAYVVLGQDINVEELREKLRGLLPEYMIPDYITHLAAFPMTKNGKLDKKALPDIVAKSLYEYEAPRNETEKIVCEAFEEILGIEKAGIKDNFFELGGHSLKATRLINLIEAKTGCKVALKDVFTSLTVENIALVIRKESSKKYIPIPKAEEREYYSMSSAQRRIYLINQIETESTAYNMPGSLKMPGNVNIGAMKHALGEVIKRHEILRTEFAVINGELVQRIQLDVEAEFDYIEDTSETEQNLISSFVRSFNLAKAPLVRMRLVKMSSEFLILFDMHHIIGDGMSMVNFIKELTTIYNGNKLNPLTHNYKDYSEWMRKRDFSSQKDYWLNEFGDEIPILNLPLDFSRPQKQSYLGAITNRILERSLGVKIKELARKSGATDYMVFLSAAMILLGKYCRQEDIVIGTPISARTHKDTEDMLGMFVNTLAMRGRPVKIKEYFDFLNEIRNTCLKAYEYQEYPFEELVEAVNIQRDLSRNPLFDVMLVLQNNDKLEVKLDEVLAENWEQANTVAKFDLTFNIDENDGKFMIGLEYCTDLFKTESAEAILKHYVRILEQITDKPAIKICDIEVITQEEKLRIIEEFNATEAAYPKDKMISELFEEQVKKSPDKVAAVCGEIKLTYRELNNKANQLAGKLRKLGVKPNDFVPVMTGKSTETVIGILGILKAGGAYVPIDPTYPEERIRFMLHDCNAKAVIVFKTRIVTELPVIDLAVMNSWEEAVSDSKNMNKPDDLAYVIYTSGTTGQPKGVMISHKNVVTLVKSTDYTELNEDTVILQTGQLSFDASTFEIWGSILNGGQVHFVDEMLLLNCEDFKQYLINNGINTMFITTALFNQMINTDITIFDSLKHLMFGGEKTSEQHVQKLARHNKDLDFRNVYGPTETTTFASHYIIGDMTRHQTPIGRPVSNTQMYVMDGNNLCGIGVWGELCIAGTGVAKGYLNQPELTAEKFTDNHFGEGKLYHSGDLVRWLSDGNIEFMGRIDEQVKIRGFRIEPEEVNSVIRQLGYVKDSVVIIREDDDGKKALCAYFVSDNEINPTVIKESLRGFLPEYMLPTYIMQIENLPVTRNGKINQNALPNPVIFRGNRREYEYIAAENEYEIELEKLWKKILKLDEIGINDNFFEIGGSSILIISMQAQIEAIYPQCVKVGDIFANPTIKALAEHIEFLQNGGMHCEDIAFPNGYFDGNFESHRSKMTYENDDELFKIVHDLYQRDQEELHSIFMLVYWHVLSKVTDENSFYICEARDKQYCSFLAEMDGIDDYNLCKERLKECYGNTIKYYKANPVVQNKLRGVLPILLYQFKGDDRYRSFADVALAFDMEDHKLIFTAEVINRKINPNIIFDILEKFISIFQELFIPEC